MLLFMYLVIKINSCANVSVLGFQSAEQLDPLEIQDGQMTGFHREYVIFVFFQ